MDNDSGVRDAMERLSRLEERLDQLERTAVEQGLALMNLASTLRELLSVGRVGA